MQAMLVHALDAVGSTARGLGLIVFIVANAAYVGGVIARKSAFVNRWTTSWIVANVTALAIGAGVPMATGLMSFALGGGLSAPPVESVTTK